MDIGVLYEVIAGQIVGANISLSGDSVKLVEIDRLCGVFCLDKLLLSEAKCSLIDGMVRLTGCFDISDACTGLKATIDFTEEGELRTICELPAQYLDDGGMYCLKNGSVEIILKQGAFSERIAGSLRLGALTFTASSQRKSVEARRSFLVEREEGTDAVALLEAFLEPFGLPLSIFGIEKTDGFQITDFAFTYQVPDGWLAAEKMESRAYRDSSGLKLKTDVGFGFNEVLGLKNLGFSIEKYGERYALTLSGILDIFQTEIPFLCCYNDAMFSIAASQCNDVRLNAVEDMGGLVGEKNILANFPADFVPSGEIKLYHLCFAVSSDFQYVQKFDIAVLLDYRWKLCSAPEIAGSDIVISFAYMPGMKQFYLGGNIDFCKKRTKLWAGLMLDKAGGKYWRFGWRLYDDETIQLTDLLSDLALSLGVSSTAVKLPMVEVGHVAVTYVAGTFSISADIIVSKSRLFSGNMKISMESGMKTGKRDFSAKCSWRGDGGLTVKNILEECQAGDVAAALPECITSIGVSSVELSYDLLENRMETELWIDQIGMVAIRLIFGEKTFCSVRYIPQISSISLLKLPIAGTLVEKYLSEPEKFAVSNLVIGYRSDVDERTKEPAGLFLSFQVMGEDEVLYNVDRHYTAQSEAKWHGVPKANDMDARRTWLYKKEAAVNNCMQETGALQPPIQADKGGKVVWLNLEKSMAIFTLHRFGIGVEGTYLQLLLDASFAVSPLTFGLSGAGIGVSLTDCADIKFYISGFAVAFQNEILTLAGEFHKNEGDYIGALLIKVKQIAVTAVAEYTKDGCLMAYAVAAGRFGGPPAFYVTGIALGFGYHKRLVLPQIEQVAKYPLITAAKGEIGQGTMVDALHPYIKDEHGQKFLAAGIRFSSFEIIDSVAILTVGFGNEFEVGLLGISDITMPPRCDKTPIAHAGLALEAKVKPKDGVVSVEARLTSDSYILARDCRLTGGFAFYYWFGGANSGDMVVTLGGYKADYKKPAHYPDVPRVGFEWNIGKHLNISGELYFALTPKEVMAGGRLSAVYSIGKLKAYFIAAADFYLGWKPFYYEASIQVLIGASYRVDFWFVHKTFKVELGAGLYLCGPEFYGKVHISWFIISFDIEFGDKNATKTEAIGWEEFAESFLPKEVGRKGTNAGSAEPLAISFLEGVVATEAEHTRCNADHLEICVESAIPPTAITVQGQEYKFSQKKLVVRPMGDTEFKNCMKVSVFDASGQKMAVQASDMCRNVPAALWGKKDYAENIVRDVTTGVCLRVPSKLSILFPEKNVISLEQLYLEGTISITDAYEYMDCTTYPIYEKESTIQTFAATFNEDEVVGRREALLNSMGITVGDIRLLKFAQNAENLFSEGLLVKGDGYGR